MTTARSNSLISDWPTLQTRHFKVQVIQELEHNLLNYTSTNRLGWLIIGLARRLMCLQSELFVGRYVDSITHNHNVPLTSNLRHKKMCTGRSPFPNKPGAYLSEKQLVPSKDIHPRIRVVISKCWKWVPAHRPGVDAVLCPGPNDSGHPQLVITFRQVVTCEHGVVLFFLIPRMPILVSAR